MAFRTPATTVLHDPGPDQVTDELVVLAEPGTPAWVGQWLTDCERPVARVPHERGPALVGVLDALADRSVLVARASTPSRPGRTPRVAAALRDLPSDAPVLAEAMEAARLLDGEVVVVHAVPLSFGERSVGLDAALRHGTDVLAEAMETITAAGAEPNTRLARVRPHELLGEDLDADLVVVGGARRGGSRGLGLVAGSAVQHAPCPVLVVPREG
jgi:nucleotide-binding universal stress UspA family protein